MQLQSSAKVCVCCSQVTALFFTLFLNVTAHRDGRAFFFSPIRVHLPPFATAVQDISSFKGLKIKYDKFPCHSSLPTSAIFISVCILGSITTVTVLPSHIQPKPSYFSFPTSIRDFDSLKEEDHAANLQLAFDISEREFGIQSFTSAKELSAVEELDKSRMITYLSKFYELFRGTPLPASGALFDPPLPCELFNVVQFLPQTTTYLPLTYSRVVKLDFIFFFPKLYRHNTLISSKPLWLCMVENVKPLFVLYCRVQRSGRKQRRLSIEGSQK